MSKLSTRHSTETTTLSIRADAFGVDDYSGCTEDLKRHHLATTTGETEQLSRLNETVTIVLFHHHSKTQHSVPVRFASAPHPALMETNQTSEDPYPLHTENPTWACPGHTGHTGSTYLWEEEEWLLAVV